MTIDILALAMETYLGTEDSEQHWIAFGNAIIERCAAELEEYGGEYYVNSDMTCGERNGIELAAGILRSMKAPTP